MRRRIIIILIAALVLIILSVAIVLLVDRTPTLQNALSPESNTNITTSNTNETTTGTNFNTNTNPDLVAIQYVSRNFSELYGSGTTQNDSANIVQAKIWGTVNFNAFLDRLVTQARAQPPNEKFIRTITSAMVIKVTRQTVNTAAVMVTTRRSESGDTGDREYYQDLSLELVKQGTDWKINAATWKPLPTS